MAKDPWHFERPEYTRRILTVLNDGPAHALTLFGPRRTGKTEFLLKDLAPLAESAGQRVIYASFWQAPLSPLAVLIHALEQGLENASFSDRVRSAAVALAPKLKLSAPIPRSYRRSGSRPQRSPIESFAESAALPGRPVRAGLTQAPSHHPADG